MTEKSDSLIRLSLTFKSGEMVACESDASKWQYKDLTTMWNMLIRQAFWKKFPDLERQMLDNLTIDPTGPVPDAEFMWNKLKEEGLL